MAGKTLHMRTKKHNNAIKENMQNRSLLIKNKIIEMNNELARIQK